MKHDSISKLAADYGLSRSTLLYYDRIGLLPPSGRTGADYRYYTEKDRKRLERICHLRRAGLTLAEIQRVLAAGGKPGVQLIRKRLEETSDAVLQIRTKQRILASMLERAVPGHASAPVDKEMWIAMLQSAGMDEQGMLRWHREFERRSPSGHQEFLVSLGLPPDEVKRIRELSITASSEDTKNET